MSGLERVTQKQEQQAKRNEAYRKELAEGGPRRVMESGRAKDYVFTKLIDRVSVKTEHRRRGK